LCFYLKDHEPIDTQESEHLNEHQRNNSDAEEPNNWESNEQEPNNWELNQQEPNEPYNWVIEQEPVWHEQEANYNEWDGTFNEVYHCYPLSAIDKVQRIRYNLYN